ncbi:hypothetical protein AB0G32_17065 [Streptomyces sp. NPDC023723]|uniref:hypothetical protein n=1 Tax=Streptomyces sp. NPDC023723 TaxID=3154323 RepID=UPI0033F1981C
MSSLPSWSRPPRRRSLLATVAGAALLAGCTGSADSGGPDATSEAADRARARAARDSTELAGRYDAVLAAHPALAARLGPLRAEVVRHAAAFGGTGTASPSAAASPSGSARAAGPDGAAADAVPAAEQDALALLATAERKLSDRRLAALGEVPGELARLLASVAAAGSAHVYLLTEGDR